ANGAMIFAARSAVKIGRIFSEVRLEEIQRTIPQICPCKNAEPFHLCRGHWPYAVKTADWQARDESRPLRWRNDAEAVRLVLVRGKLGDELVVGDTGRCGEAGLAADAPADRFGDGSCRTEAKPVFADVEISLVQRERLDQIGIIREDRADLARDRAVDLEPRLDENEFGASPDRGYRRHCRAHA